MGKSKKTKPAASGFFMVSYGAVTSPEFMALPQPTKILYLYLCLLRNSMYLRKQTSDFSFWIWEKQLIEITGLSHSSIQRGRKQLSDACLVAYSKDDQGRPTYTLCDDVFLAEMEKHMDKDCLDHSLDCLVPKDNGTEFFELEQV